MKLVAKILDTEIEKLALDNELSPVGWDSLATLTLMSEMDAIPGLFLDWNEIPNAQTLEDIYNLITPIS